MSKFDVNSDSAPSVTVSNSLSTLRAALVALGGWFVGKGYLSQDLLDALIPVALVVGPVIWAWISNFNNKKKFQAAIDAPAGRAQ